MYLTSFVRDRPIHWLAMLAFFLIITVMSPHVSAAAICVYDEFPGNALDSTKWDKFRDSNPSVSNGNLNLNATPGKRAEIQSKAVCSNRIILSGKITSSNWKPQDNKITTDSTFGFENFTGPSGNCHYAVLLTANGHLGVLKAVPNAQGECFGDPPPDNQKYIPISRWDAIRAGANGTIYFKLTWTQDEVTLVVNDGGKNSGTASYRGPAIPLEALKVRLNADCMKRTDPDPSCTSDSDEVYFIDNICASLNDTDCDGIPDKVEREQGTNPDVKDNDIFNNDRLFAMQQYRDFLRREGDTGGIAYWKQQLASHLLDRAEVSDSFLSSPEFEGRVAPIVRLYFAYFQRTPDYGGLWYWVERLSTGTTLSKISQAFADSDEFKQKYGNLDCEGFVSLIYDNVLERDPDAGGLAYWIERCHAGMSRGNIMLAFAESPEFKENLARNVGNQVLVVMVYVSMLQRNPDADGYNYWLRRLENGLSRPDLINEFLNAHEYWQRFLP